MERDISTIFALSTAFGKAGVAVVRLSGPRVISVVRAFGYDGDIVDRRATYVRLHSPFNQREVVDNALFIYFAAPRSFTGEDVLELHVHGSIAVVKEVLEILGQMEGLRLAEPGEFTKSAFMNGKLDLIQVEALNDLISAENRLQKNLAIHGISGQLKQLYDGWRSDLVGIMTTLEAYIDFPDDDIPLAAIQDARSKILSLMQAVENYVAESKRMQSVLDGVKVPVVGSTNVGKSSIVNLMLGRSSSIVTEIAGTTRDVLQSSMEIDGMPVILLDTAGMRISDDPIEREGVRRSKEATANAHIILMVLDINDADIFNFVHEYGAEISQDAYLVVALNKSDLIACTDDMEKQRYIKQKSLELDAALRNNGVRNEYVVVDVSAYDAADRRKLCNALAEAMKQFSYSDEEAVITNIRQMQRLESCVRYLRSACEQPYMELMTQDVRFAAGELSVLVGDIDLDDILDELFSNFCIGK